MQSMKRLEIGVFLPIGKQGFVLSTNAQAYVPSFADQLEITRIAEDIGLDYVFSMAKWRGFGGTTQFWDSSFESFSLMAALAATTDRIRLIATVNPLLFHPALMAKMAATVDEVSQGRLGLNIITGSVLSEYTQMGVLPDNYDQRRYEYASEWMHVLKRLWSEDHVTHDGEFFQLVDCVSEPKPVQRPRPQIICAASSEEGLRFTAREADYSFINGDGLEGVKQQSLNSKRIALEEGTTIKTATTTLLGIRGTTEEASTYWEHLMEGADDEAIFNMGTAFSQRTRENKKRGALLLDGKKKIHSGRPFVGAPQQIADEIIKLAVEGDIDSILLVFPDYVDGLRRFGSDVMPLLSEAIDVGFS